MAAKLNFNYQHYIIACFFLILLFPHNSSAGIGDTLYVDFPSPTDHLLIETGDDFLYTQEIIGSRLTGRIWQTGGWNRLEPHFSSNGTFIQGAKLILGARGGSGIYGYGSYSLRDGYLRVHGDVSIIDGDFSQSGGSVWLESPSRPPAFGGSLYVGTYAIGYGSYRLYDGDLFAESEYIGGEILASGVRGNFRQFGGFNRVERDLILAGSSGGIGEYELRNGSLHAGSEYVGYAGEGTFNHSGGTNHVDVYLIIGQNSGSTGTYTLSDGGWLTVDNTTVVGASGTGSFILGSYGRHRSAELAVGYWPLGSGTYTLEENGALEVSGTESVGVAGRGVFNHNGGTNTAGEIRLGVSSAGYGEYNLSGPNSSVSVTNEYVGVDGYGVFFHSDGSNEINGVLYLGYGSSGYGKHLMTGNTTLSAVEEVIGYHGEGNFIQEEGSINTTNILRLGQETGAYGIYDLRGGELLTEQEYINKGYFYQTGGTHNTSNMQIGTNANPELTARYYLIGGELNANQVIVGEGDDLTYSRGSLNANLANYGITNYIGAGETLVHNGNIVNYPSGTINTINDISQTGRVDVHINGDIRNDHDSHFNVTNTNLQITGDFINNGLIKVTDSDVDWGNLIGNGPFISDPSRNTFDNLFIGELGYLIGGVDDYFFINGDFTNSSTQHELWDTANAYLGFSGDGAHQFSNLVFDGFADEYLWGTMEVVGGDLNVHGTDVYLHDLILGKGSELILDGVGLSYYNLADYGGTITLLNGAELNQVPEPATLFLLGIGLVGLAWFSRRKFRQ